MKIESTPQEIKEALLRVGVELHTYDPLALEFFCIEMRFCSYGAEQTAQAFLWFHLGWRKGRGK